MACSKPPKQENHWCIPEQPLWKDEDGHIIREFYETYVEINGNEWHNNCVYVDTLLRIVHEAINEKTEKDPKAGISHKHYLRMGSSREGTKVSHANAFDAVFPFTFKGKLKADVVESPSDGLPAGTAKIRVYLSGSKQIIKHFTVNDHKGQRYVSAQIMHDVYFKSIVDAVVEKIENGEIQRAFDAEKLPYDVRIRRVANPPAVTVKLDINDHDKSRGLGTTVSIDIVPSFELPKISNKKTWKFYVPNENLREPPRDPHLTWRVSFSPYELDLFQPEGLSERYSHRHRHCTTNVVISAYHAYRILKALHNFDETRKETSQFGSVLQSYHLKNIYLYSIKFIHDDNFSIHCVSHALAIQVRLLERALSDGKLIRFTDISTGNYVRQNLFSEIRDSLEQVKRDFQDVLEYSRLRTVVDRYLKERTYLRRGKVRQLLPNAIKRVDNFYNRVLLD